MVHEELPADKAAEVRPGGLAPSSGRALGEAEYVTGQYRRARKGLMKALEMLDVYEEMGIKPCDISVLHQNIKASFGY